MPSQPRTNSHCQQIAFCLAAVTFFCVTAVGAFAASAASADQGDYSGNMLAKVTEIWAPPPALKSDFKVRIKVSVDGKGKVLSCKAVKSSGLDAFDSSVCGAVRQIGAFGTPPYGAPMDVHMTFWSGTPKGVPRPETVSQEEALRAEVRARTKAEAAINDTRASSAEDRARERAEAIARESGAPLPEAKANPAAPRASQPTAQDARGKGKKNAIPAGLNAESSPATQMISQKNDARGTLPADQSNAAKNAAGTGSVKTPPLPTYGDPDLQEPSETAPRSQAPESTAKRSSSLPEGRVITPQSAATDETPEKYGKTVSTQLRKAILIPVETEPGTYRTHLRLMISPTGEITDFKVLEPTGDKLLDKYVQRGIRRAGSVPPPPAELGGTLDITLTLVRR